MSKLNLSKFARRGPKLDPDPDGEPYTEIEVSVRTRDPRKGFVDVHGVAVAKIVGKPGTAVATHPGKLSPNARTRYADRFAGDALETLLGGFDPVDSRKRRLRAAGNVLIDYGDELREHLSATDEHALERIIATIRKITDGEG